MKKQTQNEKHTGPYCTLVQSDEGAIKFPIKTDKFLIGRLKEGNDISLLPDNQNLVTRTMHCSIETSNGIRYLVDNASTNGTFLKRKQETKKIVGREKLQNEDVIQILREISGSGDVQYWEITFYDPEATVAIKDIIDSVEFEYDWIQAKAFRIQNDEKTEIKNLTPLEHKLIRYLDQENKKNNNVPVMCSHADIIGAIWEELKDIKDKGDVNHLVAALRKKIELSPNDPKILVNVRGMGYCLVTNSGLSPYNT